MSLSVQLKCLSNNTKPTLRHQLSSRKTELSVNTTPSFLFDSETASTIDPPLIYKMGLSGIYELSNQLPILQSFEMTLFEPVRFNTTSFNRNKCSTENLKKIDKEIRVLLRVLSPFLEETSCQKVLEFLVRFYRVHEFHSIPLLSALFPFHEDAIFAKGLQLLKLSESRWDFLYENKLGETPQRNLKQEKISTCSLSQKRLLKQMKKDIFLVEFVGKIASKTSKVFRTKQKSLMSAENFDSLFSFSSETLLAFFETCDKKSLQEKALRAIFPFVFEALECDNISYFKNFSILCVKICSELNLNLNLLDEISLKCLENMNVDARDKVNFIIGIYSKNNQKLLTQKIATKILSSETMIEEVLSSENNHTDLKNHLLILLCQFKGKDSKEKSRLEQILYRFIKTGIDRETLPKIFTELSKNFNSIVKDKTNLFTDLIISNNMEFEETMELFKQSGLLSTNRVEIESKIKEIFKIKHLIPNDIKVTEIKLEIETSRLEKIKDVIKTSEFLQHSALTKITNYLNNIALSNGGKDSVIIWIKVLEVIDLLFAQKRNEIGVEVWEIIQNIINKATFLWKYNTEKDSFSNENHSKVMVRAYLLIRCLKNRLQTLISSEEMTLFTNLFVVFYKDNKKFKDELVEKAEMNENDLKRFDNIGSVIMNNLDILLNEKDKNNTCCEKYKMVVHCTLETLQNLFEINGEMFNESELLQKVLWKIFAFCGKFSQHSNWDFLNIITNILTSLISKIKIILDKNDELHIKNKIVFMLIWIKNLNRESLSEQVNSMISNLLDQNQTDLKDNSIYFDIINSLLDDFIEQHLFRNAPNSKNEFFSCLYNHLTNYFRDFGHLKDLLSEMNNSFSEEYNKNKITKCLEILFIPELPTELKIEVSENLSKIKNKGKNSFQNASNYENFCIKIVFPQVVKNVQFIGRSQNHIRKIIKRVSKSKITKNEKYISKTVEELLHISNSNLPNNFFTKLVIMTGILYKKNLNINSSHWKENLLKLINNATFHEHFVLNESSIILYRTALSLITSVSNFQEHINLITKISILSASNKFFEENDKMISNLKLIFKKYCATLPPSKKLEFIKSTVLNFNESPDTSLIEGVNYNFIVFDKNMLDSKVILLLIDEILEKKNSNKIIQTLEMIKENLKFEVMDKDNELIDPLLKLHNFITEKSTDSLLSNPRESSKTIVLQNEILSSLNLIIKNGEHTKNLPEINKFNSVFEVTKNSIMNYNSNNKKMNLEENEKIDIDNSFYLSRLQSLNLLYHLSHRLKKYPQELNRIDETSNFFKNLIEIIDIIGRNEFLLKSDKCLKAVGKFLTKIIPLLIRDENGNGTWLKTLSENLSRNYENIINKKHGTRFLTKLFEAVTLNQITSEFVVEILSLRNNNQANRINSLISIFTLFPMGDQADLVAGILKQMNSMDKYTENNKFETIEDSINFIELLMTEWKSRITPCSDIGHNFVPFLMQTISSFDAFKEMIRSILTKDYSIRYEEIEKNLGENLEFEENLYSLVELHQKRNQMKEMDLLKMQLKINTIIAVHKFYLTFDDNIGNFMNTKTLITSIRIISESKPKILGEILREPFIKSAVRNDLKSSESLECILSNFEKFIQSIFSDLLPKNHKNEVLFDAKLDILTFFMPLFDSETITSTYRNSSNSIVKILLETTEINPNALRFFSSLINEYPETIDKDISAIFDLFCSFCKKEICESDSETLFKRSSAIKEFLSSLLDSFEKFANKKSFEILLTTLEAQKSANIDDLLTKICTKIEKTHLVKAIIPIYRMNNTKRGRDKEQSIVSSLCPFLEFFFSSAKDLCDVYDILTDFYVEILGDLTENEIYSKSEASIKALTSTFCLFACKISEDQLNLILGRLSAWAMGFNTFDKTKIALPSKRMKNPETKTLCNRRIAFFELSQAIAHQIKELIAVCYDSVHQVIISSLDLEKIENNKRQKSKDGISSTMTMESVTESKTQILVVDKALSTFCELLSVLQSSVWSDRRFEEIAKPFFKLLGREYKRRTKKEYLEFTKSSFLSTLNKLSLKMADNEEAKSYINRSLIHFTHNKHSLIRLQAIKAIGTFFQVIKPFTFSVENLNLAISSLCERLEDDNSEVERESRLVLRQMEEITGESIESYLK